jgi:tripartite-type tricarboxylate transporter receptor subunit TctC
VSVSKRKSRAEAPPIVSESRRTRHGRVGTTMLRGRPFRVKAIQFPRRRFLRLAAGATALSAVSYVAKAQTYPTRPVTMIVPSAAGGISDVEGRVVAERMRKSLGRPIIIENVSGADGSIGVGRVAHARPDGYTIAMGFLGTHVLNGAFYSLQYDVLNDFEPISPLTTTPFILFARKTMPAKYSTVSWQRARRSPANLNAASAHGGRALKVYFADASSELAPATGEIKSCENLPSSP